MLENPEIERLKGKVGQLEGDLAQARKRLDEARIAASPFSVGDEIETRVGRGGAFVPAIIREVEPKSWGESWYKVSLRKKDGAWDKAAQRVFSTKDIRRAVVQKDTANNGECRASDRT